MNRIVLLENLTYSDWGRVCDRLTAPGIERGDLLSRICADMCGPLATPEKLALFFEQVAALSKDCELLRWAFQPVTGGGAITVVEVEDDPC